MLKHQLLSIFLTVLFFNSSAQFILNQDNINADQVTFSMETFVDRALQHFDDESNQVAGYQIVFSKNGQLYHQESRGWAIHPDDHSGDGVTMENTTRFDVASVSKWLCAIVMANVMDQNNIDWDDSVGPYLPPSWPAQMAPEYFNQSSDCYLTFGKLMRHQTCLGWSGDNSGPLGGDKNEILDALGPASLNEAEFGEYQNGNFAFARYLIAEILVGGFMNENSSNYDDLVKAAYLTALKNYVFDPLGLSTPSSIADFNDFYDGDVPHRYAFPFNPNQTCDGVLGVDYSPSSFDFLGSTGAIISSIELAAIMAYFVHDDSGTVIPAGIRDEMLVNGYGLSQSEWNGGITTYGQYYRKGGLLSKTCGEDENVKRGYRSSVVAYPNGVEVVVLSNSRVDFLGDLAREWEDSWLTQECSFVHTTTDNSVTNHFSMIDNPLMNNDQDRLVFASP
ncbi:MAG: beta-lactamase family protein, partial [Flavobacteriales bacterium]|nr:beta-lactamase family protein [Flavobacteriales bacterium]